MLELRLTIYIIYTRVTVQVKTSLATVATHVSIGVGTGGPWPPRNEKVHFGLPHFCMELFVWFIYLISLLNDTTMIRQCIQVHANLSATYAIN